ncbi:MAG: hypothetical protein U0791_21520 [Gemmataceae bacterium]
MDHNAQKQRHEQARKKHKHDQEQHAREVAKLAPSKTPRLLLVGGIVLVLLFILGILFVR